MTRKRRRFTVEFKARVALEAIKNQNTLQEIASCYEVHPNQVAQWKKTGSRITAWGIFTKSRSREEVGRGTP
ncbi:MAG: transposase [Deltaproteobacteria bacterium]|nr:transposase [Deltaproteobacteria bacterium]